MALTSLLKSVTPNEIIESGIWTKKTLKNLHEECRKEGLNYDDKTDELVKLLGGIDEILKYYLSEKISEDNLYTLQPHALYSIKQILLSRSMRPLPIFTTPASRKGSLNPATSRKCSNQSSSLIDQDVNLGTGINKSIPRKSISVSQKIQKSTVYFDGRHNTPVLQLDPFHTYIHTMLGNKYGNVIMKCLCNKIVATVFAIYFFLTNMEYYLSLFVSIEHIREIRTYLGCSVGSVYFIYLLLIALSVNIISIKLMLQSFELWIKVLLFLRLAVTVLIMSRDWHSGFMSSYDNILQFMIIFMLIINCSFIDGLQLPLYNKTLLGVVLAVYYTIRGIDLIFFAEIKAFTYMISDVIHMRIDMTG
eukprot:309584_1